MAAIAAMISRIDVTSNGKKYLLNSTFASACAFPPSLTLSNPSGASAEKPIDGADRERHLKDERDAEHDRDRPLRDQPALAQVLAAVDAEQHDHEQEQAP